MRTTDTDKKFKVFYADDDEDDLLLFEEALNYYASNIELVTATDGVEAIKYLEKLNEEKEKPCLILLDMNMPRLSGKDVLVSLRKMEHLSEIPVVMFTTSILPSDRAFANQYGAGFVTKPVEPRQLNKILENFIGLCSDDVRKGILRQGIEQ